MRTIFFIFLLINTNIYPIINPKIEIIGWTIKKRAIELYKFGNGKNLIVIVAGIHGNERNTTDTAMIIIERIKKEIIKIPENRMVWIIPKANPDGYARDRRVNDNNVDINRNFLTKNWQPKYLFYNTMLSAGKNPFSENETIALKKLFESINKDIHYIVLSLHSRGNAVIPGNDSYFNLELLSYISDISSYYYNNIGYKTFGDMTTWLSDSLNIASVTIEFKTKKYTEEKEIEKILNSLLNVNIKEKFYNENIFTKISRYFNKIDYLIEDLPDDLKKRIKDSEKEKKKFYELYNECIKDEEQLLIWVNKDNLLPENYEPDDLITLTNKDFPSNKKEFQLRKILLNDLKELFSDAKKENLNLKIISAYRSYETQKYIYNDWKKKLGEKQANRVSAKPGASQHQLGTAIDFNMLDQSFENTKEGIWLFENSYKYGFILSYPKDMEEITGYAYEPWHYRYVGKNASYLIYNYFNNNLELFFNWYWRTRSDN